MADEWKRPPLELGHAGKHGSGSQSGTYYQIEVRGTSDMPSVVGDGRESLPFVIDNYWRALPITSGATKWGVNIPIRAWETDPAKHGLLSYVAAEAHRWAFLAALEAGIAGAGGALCVETRLVAIKFSQEYKMEEQGVTGPVSHKFHPERIAPRSALTATEREP